MADDTSEMNSEMTVAGVAQLVEREPSKLGVAGSSPVSRSNSCMVNGQMDDCPQSGLRLQVID